ncbi:S-adenosyl-L-methionine-dependent methyltransferases superfamily protein [Euphorbia peplus]|nr:S-adenosyl-L-methionine-dependent methyltransferases superfamily protein [Euphorbia peplus]
MEVKQVVYMKGGDGENSYHQNSTHQKRAILKGREILGESIGQVCEKSSKECLKIVDMGCSSGPNTLLPMWEMIESIDSTCARLNTTPPTLQLFLNDLPGTDFNSIFTSLVPKFYEKLQKDKGRNSSTCFVAAMPGSFYGSLFPHNSIHFVHSSSALHWCSQIPEGLVTEDGIAINKGNICAATTSSERVHELYLDQFRKDFQVFLKSRSEELISTGGMLLTFHVQNAKYPHCNMAIWEVYAQTFQDMVDEGIITQFMLDSYNIPIYAPPLEDVKNVITNEGSFNIKGVEEYELDWGIIFEGNKDVVDKGKIIVNHTRATSESMLASHFGYGILDDFYHRLSFKAAAYLETGVCFNNCLVISLTKKSE